MMGVMKQEGIFLRDLWSDDLGIALYMATMGREGFETITKFMRFDDKTTRTQRRQRDKLAPFKDIWEMFIKRCRQSFAVSDFVCIDDQQILPTRSLSQCICPRNQTCGIKL